MNNSRPALVGVRLFGLLLAVMGVLALASQAVSADCTPGNQVDKPAFFAEVARQLRNPSVPDGAMDFAVRAFLAWEPYENTAACWNPLATTLRYSDSTCRSWNLPGNSAGVQQYPSRECGIRATADTLNYTFNGNGLAYQAIRRMMAKQGFDEAALQQELRRWVGSEAYARAVVSRWRELYYSDGGSVPAGYIFCAWEGERCSFNSTADVAYGANGRFAYRSGVNGGVDCNNDVFGDPVFGVRKACYIRPISSQPDYTPPSGYTFCAWEGERCSFDGTADVAYGANGRFAGRSGVNGGIDCNNGIFGDPVPGVRKACYIKPISSGPSDCPGQYRAEYFANRSLSGSPVLVRCEGWPIAHDWSGGSPGNGVPDDGFSARWTGRARIESGTYTFIARADDGIRVWIDGLLIIDAWRDQSPTEYRVPLNVAAGEHTIRVEYYENGGGALAEFRWERASSSASCRGQPLALEQRVEGRLSNGTPSITYCLQASAGQILSARMFALGDQLDTYLQVFGPDGRLLVENDDGLNIGYNSFLSVRIPRDGVYRVVATRYGSTEGRYALRVEGGFEAAVGDLDRDCDVDNGDRDRLRSLLGSADPSADLDVDGRVSTRDAIFQMRNLGVRCN